jgi:hypothetical protein
MIKENMEAAFPDEFKDGMTLRDYFAAKAMQAYLMNHQQKVRDEVNKHGEATHYWSDEDIAISAYETADAMMQERERM